MDYNIRVRQLVSLLYTKENLHCSFDSGSPFYIRCVDCLLHRTVCLSSSSVEFTESAVQEVIDKEFSNEEILTIMLLIN